MPPKSRWKNYKDNKMKGLLNKKLTVRFTDDDKDTLHKIKKRTGQSYAEIIREAVYAYYRKDFGTR